MPKPYLPVEQQIQLMLDLEALPRRTHIEEFALAQLQALSHLRDRSERHYAIENNRLRKNLHMAAKNRADGKTATHTVNSATKKTFCGRSVFVNTKTADTATCERCLASIRVIAQADEKLYLANVINVSNP